MANPIGDAKPSGDTTRDHLANERTLLAWSRTGIAVIALGFVVARFGLLIRELGPHLSHQLPTGLSNAFGVALILCGAGLTGLALARYLRTGQAIEAGEYRWSPRLGIALTGTLLLSAVLLTIYLLVSA